MLSQAKVNEVRQLLDKGIFSQRQIARLTGVSRGTVGAIAAGKRPDYPVKSRDEEELHYELPPQRCRGCGGLVYIPCRLCRVRKIRAHQRRLALGRLLDRQAALRISA